MGSPSSIASIFLLQTCKEYCLDSHNLQNYLEFAFLTKQHCEATCMYNTISNWDYQAIYNDTNLPYYQIDTPTSYGAIAQFTLGGTYTIAYSSAECDTVQANATIRIECDESPVVDAGDDITVSRTEYGWPAVYLVATATDVNSVIYQWKVIEAPLARNTSGYDGYLNPHGYLSPSDVENDWSWTPSFVIYPVYPGIYVAQVAVYDGCSVSMDTVTVNVTCTQCEFTVYATAEPYAETTNAFNYPSVNLYSSIGDYPEIRGTAWSLDSTSLPFQVKTPYADSTYKYYDFVQVHTDTILNSTTIQSNSTYLYSDTITGPFPFNTLPYIRLEGYYSLETIVESIDYTSTEEIYLTSISEEIPMCTVTISNYASENAVVDIENKVTGPSLYPQPVCNGHYDMRVDYSDNCFDQSGKVTVTHKCAKSPIAHLLVSYTNITFNYMASTWSSSVVLKAFDSASEQGAYVTFIYEYAAKPAWDTSDTVIYQGSNTYVWSPPRLQYSQSETYQFQVKAMDQCSFSTSSVASVTLNWYFPPFLVGLIFS